MPQYKQKVRRCAIIGAMTFMHTTRLADRIDRLNAAIGHGVAWLALAVVLLQFALVVARYLFGLPLDHSQIKDCRRGYPDR